MDDDLIYAYTRAEAVACGELIDVSVVAQEAGITFPTALTRRLWLDIEAIPKERPLEDVQGRLWDVLWMGACAMRRAGGSTLTYELILNLTGAIYDEDQGGPLYTVKVVCGPGDDPGEAGAGSAPVLIFTSSFAK
jgi:hypothetical protein